MTSRSHLERRLEVQLAGKTHAELVEIIARQQLRLERDENPEGQYEIEMRERLGRSYYDGGLGMTLEVMIKGIEDDSLALGYPVREYLRRFSDSPTRRRR